MPGLIDRKLIVLSGKGGVGRTTVAAALAHGAAARGKRVLIAQTDAAERLGRMLGHAGPIGPNVVRVAPQIDVVNMTPRESLHQYALMIVKYEAVYRAIFENRAMRGFLAAVPGLDAYAMLGKAWWHTTEQGPSGAPKYDLVILDGPASGHAVAMLKIPQAVLDTTPAGPLAKDARALRDLLSDASRSAFVIVTLPEELPTREALELAHAARTQIQVPLGPVVVNAVPSARLSSLPASAVLERVPYPTGDGELDATLRLARNVQAHRRAAEDSLARLRSQIGQPVLELPWLPSVALGPRDIERLGRALLQTDAA